jgi:hypothetical protein
MLCNPILFDRISYLPGPRIFEPAFVPTDFQALTWDLLAKPQPLAVRLGTTLYSEASTVSQVRIDEISIIQSPPQLTWSVYKMACAISESNNSPEAPCPAENSIYSCYHADGNHNFAPSHQSAPPSGSDVADAEMAADSASGTRAQAIRVRNYSRPGTETFWVGELSLSNEMQFTYQAEQAWIGFTSAERALFALLDMSELMRDRTAIPISPLATPSDMEMALSSSAQANSKNAPDHYACKATSPEEDGPSQQE